MPGPALVAAAPWIAGALAAITSWMGSRSQSQQYEQMLAQFEKASQLLTPGSVLRGAHKLSAAERNLMGLTLGPSYGANVDYALARSGLTGSNAGEMLRGAAYAMPGVMAGQRAFSDSLDLAKARASALVGAGQTISQSVGPGNDPMLSAILGGTNAALTAALTTRLMMRNPATTDLAPNIKPNDSPVPTSGPNFDTFRKSFFNTGFNKGLF